MLKEIKTEFDASRADQKSAACLENDDPATQIIKQLPGDVATELAFISGGPMNGYMNATQMAAATGKNVELWRALTPTQALIQSLSKLTRLPERKLIVRRDSRYKITPDQCAGVWIHPDLSIAYALHCNPVYAPLISRWTRGVS